jgi:hypothetical protein
MKYSLTPDTRSMKDGQKIVLKEFFKYSKEGDHVRLPAEVVTFHTQKPLSEYTYSCLPKDETRPHVITSGGRRYDIMFDEYQTKCSGFKDPDGHVHDVLWTLPVPDASDEEIIAFVRAFRGEGSLIGADMAFDYDPNAVFIVESIGEKFAVCRMVSWLNDTLGEYEKVDKTENYTIFDDHSFNFLPNEVIEAFPTLISQSGSHALSAYEINIPLNKLPKDVPVGAIIVGSGISCEYKNDVLVTTVFTPRIAGHLDERGLEKWLPDLGIDECKYVGDWGRMIVNPFRSAVGLATIQDHLKEIERAKAKLIPDEALVVVFPPEEGVKTYSPNFVLLGMRGATFFDDGGHAQDNIESQVPEEGGLWVYANARYWSHHDSWSGEWDGGIEGDWRPATDEDLKTFGYTREQVATESEDAYEEGETWTEALADGSFAERMMELAAAVCASDQERVAAHTAKLNAG